MHRRFGLLLLTSLVACGDPGTTEETTESPAVEPEDTAEGRLAEPELRELAEPADELS